MNYRYQKINPQLADYVRTIVVFDKAHPCSDLPLFASGISALLYKTNGHITLFGQAVPPDEWVRETSIAVFFKPFAIGTIFNLSARNLKDNPVDINRWNAQKSMALQVQLYHSQSTDDKIEILTHFIFSQIQSNRRDCEIIRKATDTLMQDSHATILPKLLQELHLTERTFQRMFKKYVGVGANEYRRICQHYFAFSQLKGRHFEKLTDVAYSNGYFDQSHFIRSFKEFTNTTPNEYLQSGLDK